VTKARERLVDAEAYCLHAPYMGETDEAVIATMLHYERVLHAQSEHGRYFIDSEEHRDLILRNRSAAEPNGVLPAPDVSASASEAVIRDATASIAFHMARGLSRLPTEKEVRNATKRLLAERSKGKKAVETELTLSRKGILGTATSRGGEFSPPLRATTRTVPTQNETDSKKLSQVNTPSSPDIFGGNYVIAITNWDSGRR